MNGTADVGEEDGEVEVVWDQGKVEDGEYDGDWNGGGVKVDRCWFGMRRWSCGGGRVGERRAG